MSRKDATKVGGGLLKIKLVIIVFLFNLCEHWTLRPAKRVRGVIVGFVRDANIRGSLLLPSHKTERNKTKKKSTTMLMITNRSTVINHFYV